jgi:hypothetical protein
MICTMSPLANSLDWPHLFSNPATGYERSITMPSPANGKYRQCLPQLDGGLFLTDGGLETTLIFHEGTADLPSVLAA